MDAPERCKIALREAVKDSIVTFDRGGVVVANSDQALAGPLVLLTLEICKGPVPGEVSCFKT